MFSFQDFQAELNADNEHYERLYGKAKWLGKRSRLHDLVQLLKAPQQASMAQVRQAVNRIPAAAWRKYARTKAYLATQFALAGFELPEGQAAVLRSDVIYRAGVPVVGYGPRPADRIRVTGIFTRPDTRFGWSIEVRYQLAAGINPLEYAPVRDSKDELEYCHGRPTPAMHVVATTALNKLWQPDGPVYYNVKRDANTICIHDGPGADKVNATLITNNAPSYPIRMFDMFRMSLFKVKPDVDIQVQFQNAAAFRNCLGEELPGSKVEFCFHLWRTSREAEPQGNFVNQLAAN